MWPPSALEHSVRGLSLGGQAMGRKDHGGFLG